MKLILKEEIQGLGYEGDLVEVKDGYGRNYLLPQGYAILANKENLEEWNKHKDELQAKRDKAEEAARELKKKIESEDLVIAVKAGEEGQIFGSVTKQNIADAFKEASGEDLDKKKIILNENIKELGSHDILVKVFPEIDARLNLKVVSEDGGEEKPADKAKEEEPSEKPAEEVEEGKEEE